ncbi:MAG: L-2-hydroxyglutarate oxidase [Bacteroidetes bacterium]|nr:L-2-hydroxyglutarate oxidase [Bacteroidota bacterium]
MNYDVIVIGAGIVGLASAYKILLAKPNIKLLILEKENDVAMHQTGNNSGVIHSGIYYKPGSLKASNCINGYNQLLKFCDANGIKYELCGKVIVALNEKELPALDNIFIRGNENGLKNLKYLTKEEVNEIEPHVTCIKGIQVPQTGIVDYKQVSKKLLELIKAKGGDAKFNEKVVNIKKVNAKNIVTTDKHEYESNYVVSCGGLYSDKLASFASSETNFKIIPFRGEYYKIKKEKQYLVKNLIYPVPDPAFPFLGVHFTRMIEGGIEAGPNAVFAFAKEGYTKSQINLGELFSSLTYPGFLKVAVKYWRTGMGEMYRSFSKSAFTHALQQLIPEITEDDLEAGGAGVRAQACSKDGKLIDDFLIIENERMLNVCNAPSPAATSSLSIGDYIKDRVIQHF